MEQAINKVVQEAFEAAAELKQRLAADSDFISAVGRAAAKLAGVAQSGGTLYFCGNGGSACDAMHFCEELSARFKRERPGIRAMHFMDPAFLTCWANDYDFASVFERAAATYCTPADALVCFSTSGSSANVLKAVAAAKQRGCYTLGLTGKTGGELARLADAALVVPSSATERIQEVHIMLVHVFCEVLECGVAAGIGNVGN